MVAFSIFGFPVYWYGIFYALAFSVGYFLFLYLKKFSFLEKYAASLYLLLKKSPEDIILYMVIGILVGGRLGHVFIYDFSYYLQYPFRIFSFWEGGMSFIGGIFGVVTAMIVLSWKYRFKLRDFWMLADILIIPVTFGIMVGRIGNFLNQELYGRIIYDIFPRISDSTVNFLSKIGLVHVYSNVDAAFRLNTNLISSFFEGFCLLVFSSTIIYGFLKRKKWNLGFVSSLFLVSYSLIRFVLEYVRMDSQSEYLFIFTRSQWFFVIFISVGLFLFGYTRKKYYMK